MTSALVAGMFLLTASGLAFADPKKNESGKGDGDAGRRAPPPEWSDKKGSKGPPGEGHNKRDDNYRGVEGGSRHESGRSYFHQHGYTQLNIPPGHFPPPGECRIWFPGRPPGQQPPPGDCRRVPPGAWVIRHPRDLPGRVHVAVYEPSGAVSLRAIGEFEIASGLFIRVVLER
jgi:hypothetical protein